MTILAKPFSEKKGDKLIVPLVNNENLPPSAPEDIEAGESEHRPPILILTADRLSAATTLCLLLTALSVVGVGIIGGKLLYNEYFSVESQSRNYQISRNFQEKSGSFMGYAQVPLGEDNDIEDSEADSFFAGNEKWPTNDDSEIRQILKGFLPESFDINDEKKYEKIDVPDFRDGRSGRFIHDFNTNMTGIIDVTGHRCFVMPLNRENVLPPKSLFDLIHKMWEGYYKVDTDVVRRSMRVVLPPLEDTASIGTYIASECADLPIYRLEKVERGIVKRSADLHSEARFAQFAGKGITEFDIVNLDEVIAYENKINSH